MKVDAESVDAESVDAESVDAESVDGVVGDSESEDESERWVRKEERRWKWMSDDR